jgi:RimJ/RimL family protein N-acetyltransferase
VTDGSTPRPKGRTLWSRVRGRLASDLQLRLPQVVFVYRHDLAEVPAPTLGPGCAIEVLGKERLPLLWQVSAFDARELRERVERGDRCYAGFVDGRLAHYTWAQTAGRHHLVAAGRHRAIQAGEVWLYHARTAEWARGRGLYTAALRTILTDCRQQGIVRSWCYALAQNVGSQRGILRAGYVLDRRLRSLGLGSHYFPLP